MKHQAITLVKFKALGRRLKLPQYATVGVLESIWLFAQHNARDGELGGFSSLDLAAWVEWEGDADELIDALVETRWLDREGESLTVHDWQEHAPNWIKGVAARKPSKRPSAKPSSQPSPQPSCEPSAEPAPLPPNQTKPNQTKRNQKFMAPSLDDVREYVAEKGYHFDPETFIAHHEARGWFLSNGRKMVCWKSACTTFEKNHERFGSARGSPTNSNAAKGAAYLARRKGETIGNP